MQLFTNVALVIGVIAVIGSWLVAIRLLKDATSPLATVSASKTDAHRSQDVLAEAHFN
jgi:hypothetical protein